MENEKKKKNPKIAPLYQYSTRNLPFTLREKLEREKMVREMK